MGLPSPVFGIGLTPRMTRSYACMVSSHAITSPLLSPSLMISDSSMSLGCQKRRWVNACKNTPSLVQPLPQVIPQKDSRKVCICGVVKQKTLSACEIPQLWMRLHHILARNRPELAHPRHPFSQYNNFSETFHTHPPS